MRSPNTLPNGLGRRSAARAWSGIDDANACQIGLLCLTLYSLRSMAMGLLAIIFYLDQMIKEAVDDAGTMQQRGWVPACCPFPQPDLQRLPVDGRIAPGNVLEAMKNLAVIDVAIGSTQPQFPQVTGDHGVIGIRPCVHDSTSDPGTSSAMALRSSVASLR